MGLNQTKRNIILAVGIFVLAAFIYYIITMRRTFVRHQGRIPYVWNDDFNLTIRQYINTAPTRNVLVLTGPYQCGKSRALNVMANDLATTRHFVVNCDFSTAKTPEDVISLFKIGVINGLSAVRPYLSSSQINRAADVFKPQKLSTKEIENEKIALDEEKERITNEKSLTQDLIKPSVEPQPPKKEKSIPSSNANSQTLVSPSPLPSTSSKDSTNDKNKLKSSSTKSDTPSAPSKNDKNQHGDSQETEPTINPTSTPTSTPTPTATLASETISTSIDTETFTEKALINDPIYSYVFNALSHVLDDSLKRPYSLTKFIDYLESMKNYVRPVLFVHDLDKLKKSSPALYSSFFARLSRRPLYKDFVPVICEIRDSSFRLSTDPISPSIQFTEITPLKDPTRDLVVKSHVFSQIELRKIMNAFGGHGGTIERVFEDLKSGMPIDDSIKKQQEAVEAFLRKELNGDFPDALYKLCERNGTAKITNSTQLRSLLPLFASGHLYLSNGAVVRMAHTGVKNALCSGSI